MMVLCWMLVSWLFFGIKMLSMKLEWKGVSKGYEIVVLVVEC